MSIQPLRQSDFETMYEALKLSSEALPDDAVFSENLIAGTGLDPKHAQTLLSRIDELYKNPQNNFMLLSDDLEFVIDSLKNLINVDQQVILQGTKPKAVKSLQREIRAATVCMSRLLSGKPSVSK